MSLKGKTILLALAALTSTACVARPLPPVEIVLTGDAKEIAGWFSAKGEWTLFPSQHSRRYNPYVNNENAKCVSVINDTGLPRSSFSRLDRQRVVMHGHVVDYDSLSDGQSAADKLMSKKYFKGELVENYCLRQYVFVATEVQ